MTIHTYRQTYKQTDIHIDMQIYRQTYKQTGIHIDIQTDISRLSRTVFKLIAIYGAGKVA